LKDHRELLLVRHGIAEKQAPQDALRALTDKGRARMERAAAGIARIVTGVEAVYSSPLLRAMQTAQIVAAACGLAAADEQALLSPGGDPERLARWIDQLPHDGTIALVGHEPDCSRLAAWLLAGQPLESLAFRKGGACLLALPGAAAAARAQLVWFAPPRLLRRLAA